MSTSKQGTDLFHVKRTKDTMASGICIQYAVGAKRGCKIFELKEEEEMCQADELHGEGIKINCWTVDKREDAERLAGWGVDFITTNILE